jgi:methylamine dehydrogenase accessory protein MauD
MINTLIFVVAILTVLVLALLVMVFALARQVGVLFERITPVGAMINDAGPKIGEASPIFNLVGLVGGQLTIGGKQPKSMLLFFLSPTCPICKVLLPAIKSIRKSESNWLTIVLASDGEEDEHLAFKHKYALDDFPFILSQPLGSSYRVSRLPFAVLIDADGTVRAKGLVNTREQLDSLLNVTDVGYASIQEYVSKASTRKDFDAVNL